MNKMILISSALIFIILCATTLNNLLGKQPSSDSLDRVCEVDADCAIVQTASADNPCCDTCEETAITARAAGIRSKWKQENCEGVQCPVYDCYNEKIATAKCINNQCSIEWLDRS